MNTPLRLLYASLQDVKDIRAWSGSVYFIAKALQDQGIALTAVDHMQHSRLLFNKAVNRIVGLTGTHPPLPVERSETMARRFAKEIGEHARRGNYDVVFSPSSIPMAYVDVNIPKVFFTDATFKDMLEQYPEFNNYPENWIEEGHRLETRAIANCDLALYASEWAANTAIERYGADPAKVRVFPFGDNLEISLSEAQVMAAIAARPQDRLELIFLGVSWVRKGGDLALRITEELNGRGIPSRLTVVGCTPPAGISSAHMRTLPFVDKSTRAGQQKLLDLLAASHFMVLPSIAECFGLVHAEASSVGVPSLARHVGGVANAVREGRNGYLFPPDAGPGPYADRIQAILSEPGAYERLARSAFDEQRTHLNWIATGKLMHTELLRLVNTVQRV